MKARINIFGDIRPRSIDDEYYLQLAAIALREDPYTNWTVAERTRERSRELKQRNHELRAKAERIIADPDRRNS